MPPTASAPALRHERSPIRSSGASAGGSRRVARSNHTARTTISAATTRSAATTMNVVVPVEASEAAVGYVGATARR